MNGWQYAKKNQFLDLLIHASPQGIIILNFDKQIVEVNPSGLKLLNISDISEIKGKTFNDSTFELAPALGQLKQGDDMMVRNSVNKVYRCIRSSFIDQGFNHPFILIEEITHELLKIEKDSYERIIRMMSHEVNNSVGAIGFHAECCRRYFQAGREQQMGICVAGYRGLFRPLRTSGQFYQ